MVARWSVGGFGYQGIGAIRALNIEDEETWVNTVASVSKMGDLCLSASGLFLMVEVENAGAILQCFIENDMPDAPMPRTG